MQDAALKDFIEGSRWIFAKTMPECPHEYTLRRETADVQTYDAVVRHILIAGMVGEYHGYYRPYLHFDGWKYWVMTQSPRSASLINRALLFPVSGECGISCMKMLATGRLCVDQCARMGDQSQEA